MLSLIDIGHLRAIASDNLKQKFLHHKADSQQELVYVTKVINSPKSEEYDDCKA
jgi:hypothetical protein